MNKTQIQSAVKLEIQLDKARKQVAALQEQIAQIRLEALREVEMVKNDASITLLFKGRRINAKKPSRFNDRYNLTENGKRIATEVFGGIHEIRFQIAVGQI
jgi:hypothetical protein